MKYTEDSELWFKKSGDGSEFIYSEEFHNGKIIDRFKEKRKLELKQYIDRIYGVQKGSLTDSVIAFLKNECFNYPYNIRCKYPFKNIFRELDIEKLKESLLEICGIEDINEEVIHNVSKNKLCFSLITYINIKIDLALNDFLEANYWDCSYDFTKETIISKVCFVDDLQKEIILGNILRGTIQYISELAKNENNSGIIRVKSECEKFMNGLMVEHNKLVEEHNNLVEDYSQLWEDFELLKKYNVNIKFVKNYQDEILIEKSNKHSKENIKLKEKIEKLNKQIENLKTKIDEYEYIINFKHVKNDDICDIDSIHLQNKIAFVGGSESLFKKLNCIFENAEHIADESNNIPSSYINNFDSIVFLTSYMSHGLYYKIKNNIINSDIKIVHCNKNNAKLIASKVIGQINKQ